MTAGSSAKGASRHPTGAFEGPDRYVSSIEPGRKLVVEAKGDVITFNGKVSDYHLGTNGDVTDGSRRLVARLVAGRLVSETQDTECVISDVDPHDARSAMLLILALFSEGDSTTVTFC